ncbi:hypothetical protein VB834_20795 [Limnoraphis robusta Tam1]|jgi:hypothetical protein|uniref:hypothetical protein n=1 Tax=Limnoraphis robusta TaxID=1118279 RepID=UPI001F866A0F|nr:hypothetical protein [Limnoraphis robusta]MCG5058606.1 hypothetical protein [Limnoraphis sp. WC205]MCG5060160.1 hypothetical protein [Limnoraphis sp. WC205]MCG5061996.1 hypothetical protein [Limnoraphis sp. WC205]MEA5541468.1 hypothetical protein [Limnoraphis robusta Tam1]
MPKPIGFWVESSTLETVCGSFFEKLTDAQKNQLLLFCALQLNGKPHHISGLSPDLSLLAGEVFTFNNGKLKLLMQAILANS